MPTAGVELNGTVSSNTKPASATSCKAGQRLFSHELLDGDPVCIPESPQRIIALDMASVETTLLVGKELIATSGWILNESPLLEPRFAERLKPVEDVGYPANLEKVLLLKPDLILAVGGTSAGDSIDAAKAREYCPTRLCRSGHLQRSKIGNEAFRVRVERARALHRDAGQLQRASRGIAQGPRQRHHPRNLDLVDQHLWAIHLDARHTARRDLADVGLARPASQRFVGDAAVAEYKVAQYVAISDERLHRWTATISSTSPMPPPTPSRSRKEGASLKAFEEKPVWKSLKAVKAGRAQWVPEYWWRSQTYLLANKVLDDLFANLTNTKASTLALGP